jgi:bacterioferritin (cytochrome b1)
MAIAQMTSRCRPGLPDDRTADIQTLNHALAAELQLIAAYGFSEQTRLLHAATRELARSYRAHHEQHADLLSAAVRKLGGTPVQPEPDYHFGAEELSDEQDVLKLAARLEQRAVGTYLKALPQFPGHPDLANAAATILGDEAMHCAVLRQALGEAPVFMA